MDQTANSSDDPDNGNLKKKFEVRFKDIDHIEVTTEKN